MNHRSLPSRLALLWLGCLCCVLLLRSAAAQDTPQPPRSVSAPPAELQIPAIYTKFVSAGGYPIVASAQVNDHALLEAAYLIDLMLAHRSEVREAMIAGGSRLCILAHDQFTTDLPEFARLGPVRGFDTIPAKDYWDARARGTGGSQTDPYCSCGEENLLGYPGDPYATECILIHEFAHNMHLRGMVRVDPTFDDRVRQAYRQALDAGLWAGKYASVNHHEYFAEGAQSWFDDNRENDHDHNHVNTRAELLEYDPRLAALCAEVFGEGAWRYTRPATRLTRHLAGYDPSTAPRFAWPERLTRAQMAIRSAAEARSRRGSGTPVETSPASRQTGPEEPPQPPTDPLLSLERIFVKGEFGEQGPRAHVWSRKSPSNFTWESPKEGGAGRDLVRQDNATDAAEIVVPGSAFTPQGRKDSLAGATFRFSMDESKLLLFTNTRRVWRQNTRGDYWVLDVASRQLQRLGGDAPPASLMFARFSTDAQKAAYVRGNNLFVQSLTDFKIRQLTEDGSEKVINGTADWVNEEELEIRDAFRFSPDGRSIAYWQFNVEGVRSVTMAWGGEGNYPTTLTIPYPKVGEQNSATRVGVVAVDGGATQWIDLPGDPRNHYIPRMEWTPDSRSLLIQQMNRLQNTNTVYLANPETGTARVVFVETDAAWIENENPVRWLGQGTHFLWISERDGWRSVYRAGLDGSLSRIVPGEFDILQIEALDEPGGWLYFAASPDTATGRYLYRAKLDGTLVERVTPAGSSGWNTYQISPDAQFAVHTHSNINNPPASSFIRLPDHSVLRELTTNAELKQKLARLNLPRIDLVQLDIGDGVRLDAWVMSPTEHVADQKHPLLFHVYGEPWGQTVRDEWMGSQGLWHALFAQQGCFVVSVDNRGTNVPRGRAWRKSIHRQIGRLAAADQAAACRKLLELHPEIDASRVGIWGWSGGGSMSLNALFQYPDLYQTAIAIAAVPNQKLYDSIYQERYMGLPEDNAEGYRLGSPLTHAERLKGNLLLIHGTADDNVHYQGVEMLINALVANNKFFTVMPYPGRSHGIYEGRNTSRHLFALMTRYLEQHLLGKTHGPQFPQPATPQTQAQPQSPTPTPATSTTTGLTTRTIQGWTVKVNDRLLRDEPRDTLQALRLLEKQLEEIVRVVPADRVEKLRTVTLWMSPEYPGTGPRAEYHPGEGWLREHGRDPELVKGVEFTNIRIFEAETRRMPNFALHELAHAYHDQVLGYDHTGIKACYDRAVAGGRYDSVARQDAQGNRSLDKAYALSSPMEYFAELTEAFFSRNDFFPFDRQELREHDPEMYGLLKALWGVTGD